MFTRSYVGSPWNGSDGPKDYLGHNRYDSMITTRDCILALSDYPDNRLYIPTEKLIKDNFDRIIEVTEIEPLKVFDDPLEDSRLTYEIISNILLLAQDRQIIYDTTGRWWSQFALIWRQYSELSRQHLIQIYKGIYRDNDGTSDSVGNSNGTSDSTSDSKSDSRNTNDARGTNGSVSSGLSYSDGRNANITLPQDRVDLLMTPKSDLLDYADNTGTNISEQESLNTSDGESHNWGWSIAKGHNVGSNKSVNNSNNTSSSHSVGMTKGVFAIYDEWVRSYRDMTGGMWYQMQRAPLWSIFIR